MAIWKIKKNFSKETNILRGVFCPMLNATLGLFYWTNSIRHPSKVPLMKLPRVWSHHMFASKLNQNDNRDRTEAKYLSFKWANPGLFFIYFWSFQTNNTNFTTNKSEKMSIQYTAPGFEPTTSWLDQGFRPSKIPLPH